MSKRRVVLAAAVLSMLLGSYLGSAQQPPPGQGHSWLPSLISCLLEVPCRAACSISVYRGGPMVTKSVVRLLVLLLSFSAALAQQQPKIRTVTAFIRLDRQNYRQQITNTLTMLRAIQVSCNAYFAQLGTYVVGAQALQKTANLMDIPAGDIKELKKMMPFAAYGQGPVTISPFKMARVAATVAAGGDMPQGRWMTRWWRH